MQLSNSTVVRYEPRGAARQLFSTRDAELAISGPAGTGKSLACLFRLHLAALNNPGIRCLIVRKTAVSLGATTLVTFQKKVAKEALAAGVVRWYGGSTRDAASYRYPRDSVIVVGGMDRPERLLSSEFDLAFCDEATELTETDWETIGTRLRHGVLSWQQQIAACNPAHPQHWLKQRADRGQVTMLTSRHADNPAYINQDGTYTEKGRDYILGKLEALTGVRRLRLRDGIWAAAEGIIYDGWDDAVHLVDALPAGHESWPRFWCVDFGYVHAFVCLCFAEDPDGRLWLEWEVHYTGRTVDEHSVTMLDQISHVRPDYEHPPRGDRFACHGRVWTGPRPREIICDHDAEGRAVLERELGMSTTAAHKAVKEGIQATQVRMRKAGDGRPRLLVVRDCLVKRDPGLVDAKKPTCLVEEIPGYVWDTAGAQGKSGLKETPLKIDDDSCDALRYMCAARDLGARPRVRWV